MDFKQLSDDPAPSPFSTRKRITAVVVGLVVIVGIAIALVFTLGRGRSHSSSPPAPPNKRLLFVWRDAGETLALLPAYQELRDTPGLDVQAVITGHGTAPNVSEAGVVMLASLGVRNTAGLVDRGATLPAGSGLEAAMAVLAPTVVVTGLVSGVQQQIAALFPQESVYGYADGFGLQWNGTWPARIAAAGAVRTVWVTADAIASSAKAAGCPVPTVTVGSPTLASWVDAVRAAGATALADLRRNITGAPPSTPSIHFYGGYDDPNSTAHPYMDAVRLTAAGIAELQASHGAWAASFSPHPGNFSVEPEAAAFEAAGANVTIVQGQPASLLAAVANITTSHSSTTGIQSLFVGTQHVFVGAPNWPNVASSLIPFAPNATQFVDFVAGFQAEGFPFSTSELDDAGIPTASKADIVAAVRGALGLQ